MIEFAERGIENPARLIRVEMQALKATSDERLF